MAVKKEISGVLAKVNIGGPGFSYKPGDNIVIEHLDKVHPDYCENHPGWLIKERRKASAGSATLDILLDATVGVKENGGKVERQIIEVKPKKKG